MVITWCLHRNRRCCHISTLEPIGTCVEFLDWAEEMVTSPQWEVLANMAEIAAHCHVRLGPIFFSAKTKVTPMLWRKQTRRSQLPTWRWCCDQFNQRMYLQWIILTLWMCGIWLNSCCYSTETVKCRFYGVTLKDCYRNLQCTDKLAELNVDYFNSKLLWVMTGLLQ
jgi:hypothetical protein